jgi:3'(2'), 5'-bisphosphate nucleotidase
VSPAGDELLGRELFRLCSTVAYRLRDRYVLGLVERPTQHLKPDATPMTPADREAHGLLLEHLTRLTPGVPVLSEEGVLPPLEKRATWPEHWLVDPLDGTREFLDRTGQFSINLALVEGGRPVLGAIFLPLSGPPARCIQRGSLARTASSSS